MSSGNFIVKAECYKEISKKITWHSKKEDLTITSTHSIKLYGGDGGQEFKNYDPAKLRKYIKRAWWTNEKDEPITEAQVGDNVRFHIEMKDGVEDGEKILLSLYDSDKQDSHRGSHNKQKKASTRRSPHRKKDDLITFYGPDGQPITFCEVKNKRAVVPVTLTKQLETLINGERDKQIELYFSCSCIAKNGLYETADLPDKTDDYLKVFAIELPICIDMYKVPGLNVKGEDIADDMAYGFGYHYKNPIYTKEKVEEYKYQYIEKGFNSTEHALFANAEKIETPSQGVDDEESMKALVAYANRKAKYSKEEIDAVPSLFELLHPPKNLPFPYYSDGKPPSNNTLFIYFRALAAPILGSLRSTVHDMIDKFERNEGGVFESKALTEFIQNHFSTKEFCTGIEDEIAERIKQHKGKLKAIEDTNIYKGTTRENFKKTHPYGRPMFPWFNWTNLVGNLAKGTTLALNDVWAYKVILKKYSKIGNDYNATYEITLWDHFGLDLPDITEHLYSKVLGFRAWFILQHVWGYKPFITKVQFEQTFTGNLNEGRAERKVKREAEEYNRPVLF